MYVNVCVTNLKNVLSIKFQFKVQYRIMAEIRLNEHHIVLMNFFILHVIF